MPLHALVENASSKTSGQRPVRVAIADDSTVARAMMGWALEQAGINVVATANNGHDVITAIASADVDVLILDLQMPLRDGLSALPEILSTSDAAVLVVSALTTDGAQSTIEALRLGAADTLAKPDVMHGPLGGRHFNELLVEKVQALGVRRKIRQRLTGTISEARQQPQALKLDGSLRAIGIAASTGGPTAMFEFFATLAPSIQVPILVTQHLPGTFVPILAEHLSRHARRPALVAEEGQRLQPGTIHIAPGEAHLRLSADGCHVCVRLDHAAAPSGCRPSADPMFEALAEQYGKGAVAVVLSGMGRDGAEGARHVRNRGGHVLAQDVQSSVVWGMPGVVSKEGTANIAASPDVIARLINAVANTSR